MKKKNKIDQIKALILLKENKIPKKYLNTLSNREIYKDFLENRLEGLIGWTPGVIRDIQIKNKIQTIQREIIELIEQIEEKKNG